MVSDNLLLCTGREVFRRRKLIVSRPEYFLCGHPLRKYGFELPVYALLPQEKKAILRNINRPNILIQSNQGILWTIAHFVMERFVNPVLLRSSHFPVKKMMICSDSMRENAVATKIFINSQIEKKYNPFR